MLAAAGLAGRVANGLRLHGPTAADLGALFPEKDESALRRLAPRLTGLEFRNRILLESVRRDGLAALGPMTVADSSWRHLAPPAILVSFHMGALYALPGALTALSGPALVVRE